MKSLFVLPSGEKIKGQDLIKIVLGESMNLPSKFGQFFQSFTSLMEMEEREAEIIYANWVRVREMNLWDRNVFFVSREGIGPWMEQWIPWLPLLGGKSIRIMDKGVLVAKSPRFLDQRRTPEIKVTGVATKQNGLVCLNGPDPKCDPKDKEIINQSGMKEGTFGRLLVGFSYLKNQDMFILKGVYTEEELKMVSLIDSDGFLAAH